MAGLSPAVPEQPCTFLDGVRLDTLTESQVVAAIVSEASAGRGGWVVTINLDILRRLHRDARLRALVDPARFMVADGMPVLLAARLAGASVPERVTGASLIWTLSAAAEDRLSIYLLGGAPGVPEEAADALLARNPALRIAGTDSPPLGFDTRAEDFESARSKLVAAAPDIVFCGLGFPKQERVISRLRATLPHTWFIGCGAAIPFAAGRIRRAPVWMQRTGFEWLYRLMREPRRLSRRYLLDGPVYAAGLLARSARTRATAPDGRSPASAARGRAP